VYRTRAPPPERRAALREQATVPLRRPAHAFLTGVIPVMNGRADLLDVIKDLPMATTGRSCAL